LDITEQRNLVFKGLCLNLHRSFVETAVLQIAYTIFVRSLAFRVMAYERVRVRVKQVRLWNSR
jgi:hypothetical protein